MRCASGDGFPAIPGGVFYHLLHALIDVTTLLVILVFNAIIIFSILRINGRQNITDLSSSHNSSSKRLVLSLAASDILVAVSSIYFLSFEYSCAVFVTLGASKTACVARFVIFMAAAATSCYSLVALAVDRYFAVVHALRYREIMTNRAVISLITFVWLSGSATGFSLIFWNNWTPVTPCTEFTIVPMYFVTVVCGILFVLVLGVLAVLHWCIHREALASRLRKESMNSRIKDDDEPTGLSFMSSKSARVLYLVVGCMVVLWTPIIVIVIVRTQGFKSPYLDLAHGLTFSFYNLTYILNTFIYSWKNTTIKAAILQFFKEFGVGKGSIHSGRSSLTKRSCAV